MDLMVERKVQSFSKDHYQVFNPSENLLLQIDGQAWGNCKRVMRDPAGFTILTMRQKNKWEVHGGESKERKRIALHGTSISSSVTDVFLAENNNVKKSSTCNFHASGMLAADA